MTNVYRPGMPAVVLQRRSEGYSTDSLGVRHYTWAPTAVPGVLVAPGGSREDINARDQVVADLDLYLPGGSPAVRAVDRIDVASDTYEVVGAAASWGQAGVVVSLRKVSG